MTERICEFPDCGRPHSARGLCRGHDRQRALGRPLVPMKPYVKRECSVAECDRTPRAFGMCSVHRSQLARTGDLPKVAQKPVRDDIWSRVDATGDCWQWTGDKSRSASGAYYGIISTANGDRRTRTGAHRFVYELLVGPVPEGLQIDHLCRNTLCVNPDHLEPVSGTVNINRMPWNSYIKNARKSRCKHGHEFTPENTKVYAGRRQCATCIKRRERQTRDRRRALQEAS